MAQTLFVSAHIMRETVFHISRTFRPVADRLRVGGHSGIFAEQRKFTMEHGIVGEHNDLAVSSFVYEALSHSGSVGMVQAGDGVVHYDAGD
jgi:hypothetical protein